VGKVVSAAVVGLMVDRLKPRTCLLIVAALPILVLCCSFVMREERKPILGEHLMVLIRAKRKAYLERLLSSLSKQLRLQL